MLRHIDAPQRTWPRLPVPSAARSTGVPRDSPAVVCRFRWGALLRPGSSGLYVHSIRTGADCQVPAGYRLFLPLPPSPPLPSSPPYSIFAVSPSCHRCPRADSR